MPIQIGTRSNLNRALSARPLIDRLNRRFNLGLELMPQRRQAVLERINLASARHEHFLPRLNESLESGSVTGLNRLLKQANLQIVSVGSHYRLHFLEKTAFFSRVLDKLNGLFEPAAVTTGGIMLKVGERDDGALSLFCFREGRSEDGQQDTGAKKWREAAKNFFLGSTNIAPEEAELKVQNSRNLHVFSIGYRKAAEIPLEHYKGETLTIRAREEDGRRWLLAYQGEELVYRGYWDKETESFVKIIDPLPQFRAAAKSYYLRETNVAPAEVEMPIDRGGRSYIFSIGRKPRSICLDRYKGETVRISAREEDGRRWLLAYRGGELVYRSYWNKETESFARIGDPLPQFRAAAKAYYLRESNIAPAEVETIIKDNGQLYLFNIGKKAKAIPLGSIVGETVRISAREEDGRRWFLAYRGEELMYRGYWNKETESFARISDPLSQFRVAAKAYYFRETNIAPAEVETIVPDQGSGQLYIFIEDGKNVKINVGRKNNGRTVRIKAEEQGGKRWILVSDGETMIHRSYWDKESGKFTAGADPVSLYRKAARKYFCGGSSEAPGEIEMQAHDNKPASLHLFRYNGNVRTIHLGESWKGKTVRITTTEKDGKRYLLVFGEGKQIYEGYWDQEKSTFSSVSANNDMARFRAEAKTYYSGITEKAPEETELEVGANGHLHIFGSGANSKVITLVLYAQRKVRARTEEKDGRRWLLVHNGNEEIYRGYWDNVRQKFERQVERAMFSNEQLIAISSELQLGEILPALIDYPADMAEVISLLCFEQFTPQQIKALVKGFTALHLTNESVRGGLGVRPAAGAEASKDEIFIMALMKRAELTQRLTADEIQILAEIHKRLAYPKFVRDHQAALKELEDKIALADNQVARTILQETYRTYHEIVGFEPVNISTKLFLYQKIKARFLMEHDQAILADEPGLGKTLSAIAAVESLGLKKILIVCPSTVKDTWEEEIRKHTVEVPETVAVDGSRYQRERQYQKARGAQYVIVNYEELRARSPQELAKITAGLELVIVDEAQYVENPDAQQGEAIRRINPPRKWLISATPYGNKPDSLFSLLNYLFPAEYADEHLFLETYCKDTKGLKLLNSELRKIMTRSRKLDVFEEYDPARPLAEQGLKLPKKIEVPYQEQGGYFLNEEQVGIIRKMLTDFPAWAREYNARVPKKKQIKESEINPLVKLQYLFYATVDPALVGGQTAAPIYRELDRIIAAKIKAGKKVLIFANHRQVVESLVERYKQLGIARIDGTVSGWAKDPAGNDLRLRYNGMGRLVIDPVNGQKVHAQAFERHKFQESPSVRIMIANEKSGGTGLTLTAADAVIYVEKPLTYTRVYQCSDRAHRIDKLRQKAQVEVISMVGQYPAEVQAEASFRPGTVSELLETLLKAKGKLFRLVMDGIVAETEIDSEFAKSVMGLLPGFFADVSLETKRGKKIAKGEEIAGMFYPLLPAARAKGAEQQLVRTAANFLRTEVKPDGLARALSELADFDFNDLAIINAHFGNKNKYLRDQVLHRLSKVLPALYATGQTLTSSALDLGERFARLNLVLALTTQGDKELMGFFFRMAQEIGSVAKTYAQNNLIDRLTIALINLGGDGFYAFLRRNLSCLSGLTAAEQVSFLEKLGLMRKVQENDFRAILGKHFNSHEELGAEIAALFIKDFRQEFGLEGIAEERIAEVFGAWGHFDQILGLYGGMKLQEENYGAELEKFREIVRHIFAGDYREWRSSADRGVRYLAGNEQFWSAWNQEAKTSHEEVIVPTKTQVRRLQGEYLYLWRMVQANLAQFEGEAAAGHIKTQHTLPLEKRREAMFKLNEQIREISRLMQEEKYQSLRQSREELAKSASWAEISVRIEELSGSLAGTGRLIDLLQKTANRYAKLQKASPEDENLARTIQQIDLIIQSLRSLRTHTIRKNIEIIDTDDPQLIMERGALNPEMIDCFNYNGNPQQNSTIIDPLGSKNKRLLIASQDGKVMAVTMAKIRQDEQGRPVIFLERALYRGGYDFRQEMVDHLVNSKAKKMPLPVRVAVQTPKVKGEPAAFINVSATGSYAEREYAEALFGVREEKRIRHIARVVYDGTG
jgi:superfamily II DNA or RNA helicase